MNKYAGTPGTSMEQSILDEAYSFIHSDGPKDVEDQILERENSDELLNRGEICYEFANSRVYPMIVKYLKDIEDRVHQEFEEAKSDSNDQLRMRWHLVREINAEIIGNIQGAGNRYIEMLQEMRNARVE